MAAPEGRRARPLMPLRLRGDSSQTQSEGRLSGHYSMPVRQLVRHSAALHEIILMRTEPLRGRARCLLSAANDGLPDKGVQEETDLPQSARTAYSNLSLEASSVIGVARCCAMKLF